MHLSGIEVPKLGSIQDRTFRAYMQNKVGQEVSKVKLLAFIASASGNGDKTWSRNVSNILSDYVRAAYYMEAEKENLEIDMIKEYRKFAHLRPKLVIGKDGTLQVKGIPKSAL